jgi:hypothetical protein
MSKTTRRTLLRLTGLGASAGLIGGTAAAEPDQGNGNGNGNGNGPDGELQTVASLPGDATVAENLALSDGEVFFGVIDFAGDGEVRAVDRDASDVARTDARLVATFPGGVGGVDVGDGTVYAVVGDTVYEAPVDGDDGDGETVATIPVTVGDEAFANDVLYDGEHERLLVTESNDGLVYEVPLGEDDPEPVVFADDDLLAPSVPPADGGLGANGLTRLPDGNLLVAVTRVGPPEEPSGAGRLVEVPVEADGGAGAASTFAEAEALGGADGLDARGATVYVAANANDAVRRVLPNGTVKDAVTEGLSFPSDVVVDGGDLFVCNFAIRGDPADSAVFRTRP